MKSINRLQILIILVLICFGVNFNSSAANKKSKALVVRMTVPNQISGGERIKVKIYTDRAKENSTEELVFKIEVNSSIQVKSPTEIRIKSGASEVIFEIGTGSTPIKSNLEIKATLQSGEGNQVQEIIEVVPARIKSVTFNQPSIVGTRGSQIECSVELRASAPMGGIELYVSPFFVAGLGKDITISLPEIRVSAGANKTSFLIEYDEIREDGVQVNRIDMATAFNNQTRTVEFIVAVEPQQSSGPKGSLQWQPIVGIALKTKFDVIPLQVSAISVQPATITGGNEALGSFTLNYAPGNSESILFSPRKTSSAKLWVKSLGSSCQEAEGNTASVEIPLTQGVTNYNFKVCTASVTAVTTGNIRAFLRSGLKETAVTIQP